MLKLFFYTIWLFILGISLPGLAQVTSPLGRFEVDYVRGCAPLTVTVTDILGGPTAQYLYDADTCVVSSPKYTPALCPPTSNTTNTTYTYTQPGTYSLVQVVASQIPRGDTVLIEVMPAQPPGFNLTLCNSLGVAVNINDSYYDQYQIDYGDGTPPTLNQFHTYAAAGTYTVSVSGFFNNGPVNCGSISQQITPVVALPPASFSQIEVTNQATSDGSITLDYNLNQNVDYELQVSANGVPGFARGQRLNGNTLTISGPAVNTVDSIYCYRIAATDPCGGGFVYSDTVCTTFLEVLAQEGQNQLNWSTVPVNFSRYELSKNGSRLGAPINNGNVVGYLDSFVECDVNYCYTTTTFYNGGARSISAEQCVTGLNSLPPPKLETLTASVNGGTISLDWQAVGIQSYRVFRSVNDQPFEEIYQGSEIPFTDVNLRPEINRYCYYLILENSCGSESEPSVVACAIKLQGQNTQNKSVSLNWSPYSGWESGIMDYELEIMDENGMLIGPPISLGRTAMNYQDPIDPNRQVSQYRVVAISNDPIPLRSFSNIVKEDIPLQLHAPSSFTPNNDGLNDTFTAKGLFINQFTMEIYNRWGELLFHTTDLEGGWDGFYRGSLSPEDTYVYKMNATDLLGRTTTKQGTVLLLRKDF